MSEAETKVAAAVTEVAAAEVSEAASTAQVAEAVATEKIADAATATMAAATGAAALAEVHAAETIQQNEDELSWLRQHATLTESSFQNLNEKQSKLETGQAQISEALTGMAGMLSSLIQARSSETAATEHVDPKKLKEEEEGPQDPPKSKPEPKKARIKFI